MLLRRGLLRDKLSLAQAVEKAGMSVWHVKHLMENDWIGHIESESQLKGGK